MIVRGEGDDEDEGVGDGKGEASSVASSNTSTASATAEVGDTQWNCGHTVTEVSLSVRVEACCGQHLLALAHFCGIFVGAVLH